MTVIVSYLKILELNLKVLYLTIEKYHSPCACIFQQIFRPPLDDYNVLIELDPQLLPRHYQAVDTSVMLKQPKPKTVVHKALPVVNFDPAMIYLEELRVSG